MSDTKNEIIATIKRGVSETDDEVVARSGDVEVLSWKGFFILLFIAPQVMLLIGWLGVQFPNSIVLKYSNETTFFVFLIIAVSVLYVHSRVFVQSALKSDLTRLYILIIIVGILYGGGFVLTIFENAFFCSIGHCIFR